MKYNCAAISYTNGTFVVTFINGRKVKVTKHGVDKYVYKYVCKIFLKSITGLTDISVQMKVKRDECMHN